MFIRHFVLGLFLLTLALLPAGVTAQEEVFCGDLPTADCDLLMANATTMKALDSLTYDMGFTFGGIVVDGSPMEFTFNSDGTLFFGREELNAVTDEILDTTIREILKLIENHQLFPHAVELAERALKAPAADINIEINIPIDDPAAPTSFTAQIKYVDATIYVTSPLLPMAMPNLEPDQWLGLDLARGMHMVVEMLQDPALLAGVFSGMGGDFGGRPVSPTPPSGAAMGSSEINAFFEQISAIANASYWDEMNTPEFEAMFTRIVRLEDREADGMPVAVFETTIDFAALAETELFQQSFHDIYMLQTRMQGLTPEQAQALEPVVLDMVAGLEMNVTEMIGVDNQYTYGVDATWGMTIDPAKFVAVFADEATMAEIPEGDLEPMEVTYSFTLALHNHNQPVEIEAPDNSISVIDLALGMMSGQQ